MGNCQKDQSQNQTHLINSTGPVSQLKISNYVWQSAYQGLFDYDSQKVIQYNATLKQSSVIRKCKNEIQLIADANSSSNQKGIQNSLFHISKRQNFFKVFPISIQIEQYTLQKLLWLIVRTLPDQKYKICQRDIIKFGKQKVKIKELVSSTMPNNSVIIDFNQIKVLKQAYQDLNQKGQLASNQLKKQLCLPTQQQIQSIVTCSQSTCRICLQPGLHSDPLIAPCKCTGSVRYIHLKCLRTWLGKRLNVSKSKHCITLNWMKLTCQMCQQAYRYRIYLDGKKYYTVEIPKPERPYMVLQVMRKANQKGMGKVYHFVSMKEKARLAVGRKKDVDVRVSDDISVSRHHATIIYDHVNHQFVLQDNKSKFGTVVLIKKNLIIKPSMQGIGFQVGTQVYRFNAYRSSQHIQSQQKKPSPQPNDFLNVEDSQDDQFIEQGDDNSDSQDKFQEEEEEEGENGGESSPEVQRRHGNEER